MNAKYEMPAIAPEVDEDGFLIDAENWSEDVAKLLAETEVPQGLKPEHWVIIDFMREYYLTFGTVPPVRKLSRRTGFSLRQIKGLFPSGLTRGACRIAGIPRIVIKPAYLYP